jgi:hypothetical protein
MMKQSENYDEFLKKYGFTLTISKPHPKHKDVMNFEGLEANYVSNLESQVESMEKYIKLQNEKIDYLMNKEFYSWKYKEENKDGV